MNKLAFPKQKLGRRTLMFLFLSVVAALLSLPDYSSISGRKEVENVQKALASRESILQRYVDISLATPQDEWLDFRDMPDDMVLYRYCSDTLQSWANRFPIKNDDVDLPPLWYHLTDVQNAGLYNTPLAYLYDGEQFVNLGSTWYVIRVFRDGNRKIVAGIMVKTEYAEENAVLRNTFNPKLSIGSGYDIAPVFLDDGNVIYGSDGSPLFSVINKAPFSETMATPHFRWFSLLFLIMAAFSFHLRRRNAHSLAVTFSVLAVSVFVGKWLIRSMSANFQLFSPTLYADGVFFDSLAELLMCHFLVFMTTAAFYIVRRTQHRLTTVSLVAGIPIYLVYIHLTLKSVILNSDIVLELFKIDQLSIWTLLVYLAYGMLFVGLLLCLHTASSLLKPRHRIKVLSWKFGLGYALVVTALTFTTVTIYGFRKEFVENRVWTDRLSLERDLSLEMELRSIENQISSDPIIRTLLRVHLVEMPLLNRIVDQYLWNITQKYDIKVTACYPVELINRENYPNPVDCHSFFTDQVIRKYGVRLNSESPFWYINNYQNSTSYIGWWVFIVNGEPVDLYLEIDSKPSADGATGYPALLLDSKNHGSGSIPAHYSYAKFYDGRLVASGGPYSYSITYLAMVEDASSYFFVRRNGYIHFCNHTSDDGVVVLSRPLRGWNQYLMFVSYLLLLYGVFILCFIRMMSRHTGRREISLSRHSFRRRIMVLVISAMLFALAVMGVGSIIFILHLTDTSNRNQMQERLSTVQTSLSKFFRYAEDYREVLDANLFEEMDVLSANTKVDINLYDTRGCLIRSTNPAVFDRFIVSSRMEPRAFSSIRYGERMSVIQKEKISDMDYYSLYTPIYNEAGKMVVVLNMPFFLDRSEFRHVNATFIIASIINIYLILLIFTILGGATMANAISRPITHISKRMQELNISQEPHHLYYKRDDELGVLVNSYNRMVDDVKRSTLQLAQSERETAWREMARQIAHEIKNPLTPMKLSIQHLMRMKKMNVPEWEDRLDHLSESLIEQIDILSDTASEFSSFAKFYNEDDVEFDLAALLREELILFDNRPGIELEFRCEPDTAPVKLKKGQITRAFVNIISNACQALEEKGGGKVMVTLRNGKGKYRVDVDDDGPGVSQENLEKLFKPNFTTKSSGTGLGLAITKNIVEQSRGRIWYENSELGGAKFSMELPSLV